MVRPDFGGGSHLHTRPSQYMLSGMKRALLALLLLGFAGPLAAQSNKETLSEAPPVVKTAPAEQRAVALDRLFAHLRKAASAGDAQISEQAIWRLWMTSDSATANVLLDQATKALNAKDYRAAHKILDNLVAVHPAFAESWNKRATLLYLEGRFDESIADITKVLDLEPRHFGALSGLGMIKRLQGDKKAAIAAFKDALAVNPQMQGVIQAVKDLEGEETPI